MPRRVFELLTGQERIRLAVLFGLMLIATFLEALGIGLIVPLLVLLGGGDLAARLPEGVRDIGIVRTANRETLVLVTVGIIAAVYIIKNGLLALFSSRHVRFSYDLYVEITRRLFALYLAQPYTFHLQRNSAQLVNNIVTEAHFFTMAVGSGITLLTEILILGGLATLLLIVEPVGTVLIGGGVCVVAWLVHRFNRRHTEELARLRQEHDELSLQHLQQGLHAAKDVILLGREDEFLSRFVVHSRRRADAGHRHDFAQQTPRLLLEVLAVLALAALTAVLLAQGRTAAEVLPTLGLFAGVAFRVMPSLNRILVAAQVVEFGRPATERLHHDVTSLHAPSGRRTEARREFVSDITVAAVCYEYPASSQAALHGVSMQIRKGEIVGIVGPSGAGKSTLVDVMLGLLEPTAGSVLVDGADIHKDPRAWQAQIGYVGQVIYLTDDSIRRNVAFGVPEDAIDDSAVWRALEAARLDAFVRGLPDGLSTPAGERGIRFSGGERQRIGIARALYHDPAVLILDEATSSLDSATEQAVMDTVAGLRHRKTVVVVSHRSTTIDYCDRVYDLRNGRLIEAPAAVGAADVEEGALP